MIAASSNNRCVDRAVSTMGVALGYETGLPDDWVEDVSQRCPYHVITLFHRAFLGREVLVWCEKKHWEAAGRLLDWRGQEIVSGSQWDEYLFAFTYVTNDEKEKSHMVLGWPVAHPDMKVGLVLAVKI